MEMIENRRASDGETSEEVVNSSQSSHSSGSIFERCSFEVQDPSPSPSPCDAITGGVYIDRSVSLREYQLERRMGSGDTGTVYRCRREGKTYAMKVMDKQALALKKKSQRSKMELEVLRMVKHPFLPTLFAHIEDTRFSCVVTEFCCGGDLHNLRHKQHGRRFSVSSARFYAAEVLVALEYLHMLGVVYRDLKPENVLVRSDGHIMLTDFDLCMRSTSMPDVEDDEVDEFGETTSFRDSNSPRRRRPCFPLLFSRSRKLTGCHPFMAEPVGARSCSFVGTHEYVAPEVAKGESHGSSVDWWAFGVLLYEMIYGRTPFRGPSNDVTLRNIVTKCLSFPTLSPASDRERRARDLLSGLLTKDPGQRFGSKRGAAEIRTHSFFNAINFSLIRSVKPPLVPGRAPSTPTESSPSPAFSFF